MNLNVWLADGRTFLFFLNGDIHWVDAAVVESLRPQDKDAAKPAAGRRSKERKGAPLSERLP